ncbi:MAG: type II secretion system protein GspN [Deltaproteobacteria bacterium]|nr:type II secretion system protein GspN [Deltaproteobacteria bacterium]
MMKKISKNVVLYILFTIIVLGCFLYVRFPGRVVQSYLLDTMAERYPAVSLSLASVSLSFPPGLKMENVVLDFKDNPASGIRLESLRVRPRWTGYFVGRSSFAINAVAYGGAGQGRVNFAQLMPDKIPTSAEIKLENLNLAKIAYLKEKLGRQIGGKLSGVFTYRGDSQLDFDVQNGTYQLVDKLLGFDRLDFSKAVGQITLKGGLLKINKLKLTGDKINFSLKGDIVLNPDFINSAINLTGTMELVAVNSKKISLSITGTIGNAQTKYL